MNFDNMRLKLDDFFNSNESALDRAKKVYQSNLDHPNNFSYWFNRIKNINEFIIPRSDIVKIPFDIWKYFSYDSVEDGYNNIEMFVKKNIIPIMDKYREVIYFVKNGKFSDKFSFCTCRTNKQRVLDSFINICYAAEVLGAGGNTEFVIRQYIGYDNKKYATIYEGLPLRGEFRIFYDFDTRKVLYPVNYWDYDYCSKHMYVRTDRIIFDAVHEELDNWYNKYKDLVCEKVYKAFSDVDLTNRWSIDIMSDASNTNEPKFYLIDMALAKTSAYYNPNYMEINKAA